jgi:hypothetical protein
MESALEYAGPLLELMREHAAAVLALFAAGGAGTFLLKHFLGREPGTPSGSSNTASADNRGIAILQPGDGHIDVQVDSGPPAKRKDLLERYDLPRLVIEILVERIEERNFDRQASDRYLAEFAEDFRRTNKRLECLKQSGDGEDHRLKDAHDALVKRADLGAAIAFCEEIEADQRSTSSAMAERR